MSKEYTTHDIEFVCDSNELGACYKGRCPDCLEEVHIAEFMTSEECSCGIIWNFDLTMVGYRKDEEWE
jgi:hypothetical protein